MRGLQDLFNQFIRLFRHQPQDMAKKLHAAAREDALKEARFLHQQHAVDVKRLTEGEQPGPPKRAD